MRREFERAGLGYVIRIPELATEIAVDRLTRSRGELAGELMVTCAMPGVRSADGHVHQARFNLSSTTARRTLAGELRDRAPLPDVDWKDVLEDFCRRVLNAEREGAPTVVVGSMPTSIKPAFALDPILAAGKPTILYGEGGSGKSTLAVAIAVSVQTGATVLPGMVARPADVLYLDWETSAEDVDAKVKGVAMGAEIEDGVTLRYRPMVGPLVEQLESIAREVASGPIGLVVVDSVGLAAGSSSDGSDAAESALRLFSAFRQLGTTVLAIDHVAKTEADTPTRASRPYGSIYKVNLARATFELRRVDSPGDRSSLALYNTKSNVGRRLAPIGLWVEHDEGTGAIAFGRQEITGELTRPLTIADQIADVLREGAMVPKEIASIIDVDDRKVRATLSKGKGRRFVQLDSGSWGLLSHAG